MYVQTTLPDGRKAVKMVAAGASVNVPGAAMAAAASPKVRVAAKASSVSSMPDYPTMTEPDAGSFAPQAVISTRRRRAISTSEPAGSPNPMPRRRNITFPRAP